MASQYDLIVMEGPGGYVVLEHPSWYESCPGRKGGIRGRCLNWGCIPKSH